MNRKTTLAEKMRNFIEGKGFYVAVLVCVAAIGISGWYLVRSMSGAVEDALTPVSATAQVEASTPVEDVDDMEEGQVGLFDPSPSPELPEKTTAPQIETEPEPSTEPEGSASVTESAAPLVYTWPVKGEVLMEYSVETLTYDATMGDWRVHAGLDIAAVQGTHVLATAAGTVTAVDQHDLMGTTVVIDHGQGMVSTYANLQATPTVEVGDKVYTGSIIGAVGATAIAESAASSHLHFELTRDGAAVDPLEYLPQQQ